MEKYVDISNFIILIIEEFFSTISRLVSILDHIIILDRSIFGLDVSVTLFDFNIALIVVSIVIGAFVHVNKADNFYSNKKD